MAAESGDLMRSDVLDLGLCVVEGELQYWDYAKKEFLSNRAELAEARTVAEQRAEAAEQRAEAEKQRAEAEKQRRAAAELEISRLKELLAQLEPKPRGSS